MSRANGQNGRFLLLCSSNHGDIPGRNTEKLFGLLEAPNVPLDVEQIKYKVYVVGKAGIGKSFFIAWLAGLNPTSFYYATHGVQTTKITCICQIKSSPKKKLTFNIEIWESGSTGKHLPSDLIMDCPNNVDAVLLMFTYAETEKLKFLPQIMSEFNKHGSFKPCFIAVGVGWNPLAVQCVQQKDINKFEQIWKVPVIQFPFFSSNSDYSYWKNLRDSFIVFICEELCLRDQILSLQGISK